MILRPPEASGSFVPTHPAQLARTRCMSTGSAGQKEIAGEHVTGIAGRISPAIHRNCSASHPIIYFFLMWNTKACANTRILCGENNSYCSYEHSRPDHKAIQNRWHSLQHLYQGGPPLSAMPSVDESGASRRNHIIRRIPQPDTVGLERGRPVER